LNRPCSAVQCTTVSCIEVRGSVHAYAIVLVYVYAIVLVYHDFHLTWLSGSVRRGVDVSLQHTATHCNTLQHTATHCNTLQHTCHLAACITATHCNMWYVYAIVLAYHDFHPTWVCCSVLQCVAVCCSVLQCDVLLMCCWCVFICRVRRVL